MNTNISPSSSVKAAPDASDVAIRSAAVPATGSDAQLEAAWNRSLEARQEYERIATNGDTLEEQRLWAIADAAEEEIRTATATTPQGAAIQLWIALDHTILTGEEADACYA